MTCGVAHDVFVKTFFFLTVFYLCESSRFKDLGTDGLSQNESVPQIIFSSFAQSGQPATSATVPNGFDLEENPQALQTFQGEVTSQGDSPAPAPATASGSLTPPAASTNKPHPTPATMDLNADSLHPSSRADENPELEDVLSQLGNFTCGPRWSCADFYANPDDFQDDYFDKVNCACDHLCHFFNDCCADASDPAPSSADDLDFWLPYLTCSAVYGAGRGEDIYHVSRCPPDWTDETIRTKCERPSLVVALQSVPVVGVRSGLTFRNIYCGACHRQEVKFWPANVSCEGNQRFQRNMTLDDALRNFDCQPEFTVPPNYSYPHLCINSLGASSCLAAYDGTFIQDKCRVTRGRMVYHDQKPYKNIYCAACRLEDPTKVFSDLKCSPKEKFTVSLPPGLYSLSILLDMNLGDGRNSVGTKVIKLRMDPVTVSCGNDEVYDPFEKTCRPVACRPGFLFINGSCTANTSASDGNTLSTDCPRIALNESEFSILSDAKLFVNSSGMTYDPTEYFLDGSTAYVCTNFTRNGTLTPSAADNKIVLAFSAEEAIVSTVCLALSLLSLLAVLVIYSCFSVLRNTPGLILMSLALALFTAKALMLVAPASAASPPACRAVGAAMHFFFLASFFWMNVMAVDVCATFSKSFLRVDEAGRASKTFLRYSLYAWGASFLVVGTALAVDQWGPRSSSFRPRYGEGLCWITSKHALLVFFGGPLSLLVTVNIVLFICAARNIYASQAAAQQLIYLSFSAPNEVGRQGSRRERLTIYARLTAVTGLAWTFGLLAAFVPLPALWYIFIVANALQGTFLFASFALTPRVLALVSARLRSRRHGPPTSSSGGEGFSSTTQLSVYRVRTSSDP